MEVDLLEELKGEKPWQDELSFYEKYEDKVVIKHLYGPLFFGYTAHFKDQFALLPAGTEAVILRMDRVPLIDQSGLYALEDSILSLRQRDIEVLFVGLQEQPCDMLKSIDIIPDLVPEHDLFSNIDGAFDYLEEIKTKKEVV